MALTTSMTNRSSQATSTVERKVRALRVYKGAVLYHVPRQLDLHPCIAILEFLIKSLHFGVQKIQLNRVSARSAGARCAPGPAPRGGYSGRRGGGDDFDVFVDSEDDEW